MGATIHYTRRPDGRPCQGLPPCLRERARQNYDREAAALAWRRTAAFLGTHIA